MKQLSPEFIAKIKLFISPNGLESIQFTRCLFLTRLGEFENPDADVAAQEQRTNLLKQSEDSYRQILKNIQTEEEIGSVIEKISKLELKEIERPEQDILDSKAALQKLFEENGVSEVDQTGFWARTDENKCYADRRCQRLSLLLRCRL